MPVSFLKANSWSHSAAWGFIKHRKVSIVARHIQHFSHQTLFTQSTLSRTPPPPLPGTLYLSFRPQGQGKQSPAPQDQGGALSSPYSSIIVPTCASVALADSCSSGTGFCLPLCLWYPAQGSKCSLNKLINNLNQLDHLNSSPCSQPSASAVLLGVKNNADFGVNPAWAVT